MVQLHLELEVNLLVHNVIEREIEREKVQMKPPNLMEQKKLTTENDLLWDFLRLFGHENNRQWASYQGGDFWLYNSSV